MERIYDCLQRITQLWKKLELTKPNTSEYGAIMDQIRVLSEEHETLTDASKKSRKSKLSFSSLLKNRCSSMPWLYI